MKNNIKRRDFLKKAAIGGAAAAASTTLAAPAIAADRVDIAMVATWPRDFPGLGTGAQRFAERLSILSDGRFNVEYFAAGERVGAFDSFDEVAQNVFKRVEPGGDIHASEDYRRELSQTLTVKALNLAWKRLGGSNE